MRAVAGAEAEGLVGVLELRAPAQLPQMERLYVGSESFANLVPRVLYQETVAR
jgi:hypothetical protein